MTDKKEAFDAALAQLLDEQPASHLLSVPGIYEILAEHFNNDVLAKMAETDEADEAEDDEPYMTFEEFTATRKHVSDIGEVLADARWEDEPAPARGFIYLDELYIEEVQDWWPEAAKAEGKYHLLLDRDEWITDDLTALERRLYRFAKSEQITPRKS
jgi:hypothetical protein